MSSGKELIAHLLQLEPDQIVVGENNPEAAITSFKRFRTSRREEKRLCTLGADREKKGGGSKHGEKKEERLVLTQDYYERRKLEGYLRVEDDDDNLIADYAKSNTRHHKSPDKMH
eukprot:2764269-Rhodomonas_salina.3